MFSILVLIVVLFSLFMWSIKRKENCLSCFGISVISFCLGIVVVENEYKFEKEKLAETPTAMDVYQGKTTLETTYKDGIPIDSVVVFKDNDI